MNSVPPRRNPFSLSRPFPWTLVALCLGLSACNLAPDYKAPTVDTPAAFKEAEGSEWGSQSRTTRRTAGRGGKP